MSRNISQTFREAMYAQNTGEAIPMLLDIDHPSLGQTLRYTNNFENITSNGNVYEARGFAPTLPSESETRPGVARIRIDNADLEIVNQIRALQQPPPTVTMRIIRSGDPDTIEAVAEDLSLIDVRWDILIVEGDLVQEQYDREPYPKDLMTTAS